MAKMTWNAQSNEWEGETDTHFVYVDADEMAETVADAEKQGYNPDEMPEFSAESWVELGQAGNSNVKVVSKNWGGPREGAGRPKGTGKGTTYEQGYQAGYMAGSRKAEKMIAEQQANYFIIQKNDGRWYPVHGTERDYSHFTRYDASVITGVHSTSNGANVPVSYTSKASARRFLKKQEMQDELGF